MEREILLQRPLCMRNICLLMIILSCVLVAVELLWPETNAAGVKALEHYMPVMMAVFGIIAYSSNRMCQRVLSGEETLTDIGMIKGFQSIDVFVVLKAHKIWKA